MEQITVTTTPTTRIPVEIHAVQKLKVCLTADRESLFATEKVRDYHDIGIEFASAIEEALQEVFSEVGTYDGLTKLKPSVTVESLDYYEIKPPADA